MFYSYDPLRNSCIVLCILLFSGCEIADGPLGTSDPIPHAEAIAPEDPIYAPSPSPYADSLLEVAENYIEAARYDSAVNVVTKAKGVFEEIDYREGIIRSIVVHADALERWGKYGESLSILDDNLDQAHRWLGEGHLLIGDMYNTMGIVNRRNGNLALSIVFYKKALLIREKHLGNRHSLVGRSKNNIGVFYANLGDYDEALKHYKEALDIRMTALGENTKDVAQSYNNIAVALKNKGDYDESLIYHERALAIRKEVFGAIHPEVGASYYNIGVTLGAKGNYARALENHKRSLSIWRETFPNGHPLIGQNYNAISIDYQKLENYEEALNFEQRSLSEISRSQGEEHPYTLYTYANIGDIFLEQGRYQEALEYYHKVVNISNRKDVKQHPALLNAYHGISDLYYKQVELEKALHYSDLAIQRNHMEFLPVSYLNASRLDNYSSDTSLLNSLVLRAQIYKALADQEGVQMLEAALNTYQMAVKVIEAHSLSFKNDGSKLLLAEQTTSMYEEAIQVALLLYRYYDDESYLNSAFQFAELGKVSVLLDAMNEADALEQAGIPDSLLQDEKELRLLLTYHDRIIKSELTKGKAANQEKVAKEKERFFTTKKTYDELVSTFENNYPAYFDLKYKGYTASLTDVVDEMLEEDELLVEYVVGADSLYIFVVSDSLRHVEVVSIDSTLSRDVERFKHGLAQRNRESYIPSAHSLYSVLIEPILDDVPQKESWIIVADDVLNEIPFGALISESRPVNSNYFDLPYLIHNYSFRYTYSATLELSQAYLKDQQSQHVADREKKDFMAFAPVFKSGFIGWERGAQMIESFRPDSIRTTEWGYLPQSKKEVQSIQSMFSERYSLWDKFLGDRSTTFLNKRASEHRLKSIDLSLYRYLHFATHGVVNKSVPELSGIVMAQDTTGGEDGILHLSEVYNLDLDADLVVLSACQTGTGKVARGEGLMSLTRGFMYAGTDALLASYWQVADGSTNWLMVSFYDYLLNGQSKTTALRNAKLDLMDRYPQFAQPYYWASFVLIGK
ncbi:MAG: CHAT domain-containing protein [Rhodothermaceae bacterium]|nr:CHAT domain-containing protein [Rhodothermaceae bacterium]